MNDDARRGEEPPELDREDEAILDRIHDRLGAARVAAMLARDDDDRRARGPREPYTPPPRR